MKKLWFSIVMLVYQRVLHGTLKREFQYPKAKRTYCKTCSWNICLLDLLICYGCLVGDVTVGFLVAFFTTSSNAQFLNLKFLHLPKSGDKNGVEQKTVGTTSRGLVAECFLRLLKVVAKFRIPWLKSPLHIPIISPLHLHPQYIHMKWLVPKGFLPLSQIEGVRNHIFWRWKKLCLDPPLGHGGGESGQLAGSWKVGNSGGLWKWGGVQNLLLLGRH